MADNIPNTGCTEWYGGTYSTTPGSTRSDLPKTPRYFRPPAGPQSGVDCRARKIAFSHMKHDQT
jgi:hypothetical protein